MIYRRADWGDLVMARQKIELAPEEAEELGRRARATTVSPDLDSRTGFRHREWQKCWRLIKPGQKCGAKL